MSSFNGSGHNDGTLAASESPFVDTYRAAVAEARAANRPVAVTIRLESPFVNDAELRDQLAGPDPVAETIAELRAELYTREFDIAVHELIGETSALIAGRDAGELGDSSSHTARVERLFADHLAPLQRAVDELGERLAERLGPIDPLSLGEAELDEVLDRAASAPVALSPASARFLDEVQDKVKRGARGAAGHRKQRGRGGFLLKGVFKKLGTIVGTLLKKVVAQAADKLPPQYKEAVDKLKVRFGGKSAAAGPEPTTDNPPDPAASEPAPASPAAPSSEPAAGEIGDLQRELDARLTQLLLASEEAEQEATLAEIGEAAAPPADPLAELERGRARFIRELAELRDGEDATPPVENFVPVIMTALKLGIRLIGRKRVVTFLGNQLGKLITPLVGASIAPALGKVIADVGLKVLLQSEVGARQASEAAGQAVAHIVQETVRSVAALPEHVLTDEALLEVETLEAFERAAAANVPPALVRPRLREAGDVDGAWVALPIGGRRYFKKFSRPFDVLITPQLARHVRTFGGGTLAGFLRDRMRAPDGEPLRLRLHAYEMLGGGRLHHIVQHERVRGLAGAGPGAWRLFHPLTVEAAAALLQHPRLGRPAPPVLDPLRLVVGQRVYFLEGETAGGPAGETSRLHVTLDFVGDRIRADLHLSEVVAQELAVAIRRRGPAAAIVRRLRDVYAGEIDVLGSADCHRLLRVIRDGRGPEPAANLADAARAALRRDLGRQLCAIIPNWLWSALAGFFDGTAADFVAATERPADGVRIEVTFHDPPGLQALRAIFRGGQPSALVAWPPREVPRATIRITPGRGR